MAQMGTFLRRLFGKGEFGHADVNAENRHDRRSVPGSPCVGIVSPASVVDAELLEEGAAALRALGLEVRIFGRDLTATGNFAGSDRKRAASLMAAFMDPDVDAVLCARGGYGSARIVPYLDLDLIRRSGKIFVGYSDITHLLHVFARHGVKRLFHGPMVVDIASKKDDGTADALNALLANGTHDVVADHCAFGVSRFRAGSAQGRLLGGNISIVCATIGTDAEIRPDGDIVFLEETGDMLYRYDRCLDHLRRAGYFDRASAIVFGTIDTIEPDQPNSLGIDWYGMASEYIPAHLPYVFDFPCGHGRRQLPLPFAEPVELKISADATVIRQLAGAS